MFVCVCRAMHLLLSQQWISDDQSLRSMQEWWRHLRACLDAAGERHLIWCVKVTLCVLWQCCYGYADVGDQEEAGRHREEVGGVV